MKTFYTERDIVDLHARGVTEIEIDHQVVLTDLAREKADVLGVQLREVALAQGSTEAVAPVEPATATWSEEELIAQVKARVIARLGTTAYNEVLDQVIPQVLARLAKTQSSPLPRPSSTAVANDY